jgi:hypothetical protein
MFYENIVLIAFVLLPLLCMAVIYRWFVRRRAYQHTTGRAFRLMACNLLVLVIASSTVMFAGEIYYRFIYDSTDSYAVMRTTREWIERHYQFNRSRVRDSVEIYRAKRAPGKRRVTIIGDSFTAGHGVADVEDRFANLIRKHRPGWEIHVFAKNALDTEGEFNYLEVAQRSSYEFDVVLLVYCLNDISDLIDLPSENENKLDTEAQLPWLVRHSYVLDTWYHRLKIHRDPKLRDYYDYVHEGYGNEIWEKQRKRLRLFYHTAAQGGGRMAVATFPFLHSLGPDYAYRDIHTQLDQFWSGLTVPHLDLLPVFEPYDPEQLVVNSYDAHPNEFAHQKAADAMLEFLDRVMVQPRP